VHRFTSLFSLRSSTFVAATAVAVVAQVSVAHAETLQESLQRVLKEHSLMQVVENDVSTAQSQLAAEKSAWFPRANLRASAGYQDIDRDVGSSGTYDPKTWSVGATQLLWDFGATNASIERARRNLTKEEAEREAQRQNLMLAGIEAHLKLVRAQLVLDYANESEGYVKRQTQLEDIRLEAGKGYSTDVLQAKTQLAGAQARRVSAEGQLQNAVHRYRAVFGDAAPARLDQTALPPNRGMPGSLDDALKTMDANNIDVLAARDRAELVAADRDAVRRKEYMPRFDLVVERSQKTEYDGFDGDRNDTTAMVQATWQFDTGGRQSRAVAAASFATVSEREKARYVGVQASEETRNAWADLATAQQRVAFLNEQVSLAERFLELARKERELGRRSLLDVLNGETNLINARSDAAAANTDVVLASFRIMRAVGVLDLAAVNTAPIPPTRTRPVEGNNGMPSTNTP